MTSNFFRRTNCIPNQDPKNGEFFFTEMENFTAIRTMSIADDQPYDRMKEIKQFDDSKLGVKGLVDSGLTSIPRFFIHPPETLSDLKSSSRNEQSNTTTIPTVDLSGQRPALVEQVSKACRKFGFFQIVNHGIPMEVLDRTIRGVKGFHEQPAEEKARWYSREMRTSVSFLSNFDLFYSKAASWRDTLQMGLAPSLPEKIPEICRKEVMEWDQQIKRVGEVLMELLCEGLGVEAGRLKKMTCSGLRSFAGHYYPYCPQPNLTIGNMCHTDPGVLTVLLQDHIGGLQVKCRGEWVDVVPLPGALVINVGDILQMMSNDEFQSVEHRVLANANQESRVSIAVFFNPSDRDTLYGPLPELTSSEKPPLYKQFTISDFFKRFISKEVDSKSLKNYYKLQYKE